MRKYLLVALSVLFMFSQIKAQTDDNRKLIESVNERDYPNAGAVVIYDSTDADVKESGLSHRINHKLIKIFSANEAKNYRVVNLNYDPQSAYVEIKSARIYRKDGSIIDLDSNDIYDNPAPARMIYWGMRNKTIEFGRLEPGDAIEYKIFRKGFTYALLFDDVADDKFVPPMKGHFYDIVHFWASKPTLEKVYRVAMPKNKPLQYEVYNGELGSYVHFPKRFDKDIEVQVNPQAKQSEREIDEKEFYWEKDKIVYCWFKKDIEPFGKEPNMVAASDEATKLLLSTSPDWYAKAVWFHNVNEDFGSFDVTPAIREKAEEIVEDAETELDSISALTHWSAENIRYSGLSMGEGEGYTLHKGEMTFKDRCGVCKDKAGMLVTLLRAVGIESYPAMTMAGSRIDKIPADQFNHSVTLAKRRSGDWILLDPTWVPSVRELWSSAEQQQQYLMGVPGGADLKTTPLSPPENHYLKLKGESEIKDDGTLTGKFTLEAEGQSDALLRRKFVREYRSNWENVIPEYLANVSPKARVTSQDFSDPYDISEPIKFEVEYVIPDYAEIVGDKIIFTPLLTANPMKDHFTASELDTDTSLTERGYGFRQRCSKLFVVEETVDLPNYKKASIVPEFEKIKGEAANFHAAYKIKNGKLKLKAKHRMNKRLYKPKDWNSFRSALIERFRFMNSNIVLEK